MNATETVAVLDHQASVASAYELARKVGTLSWLALEGKPSGIAFAALAIFIRETLEAQTPEIMEPLRAMMVDMIGRAGEKS